MTVLACDFGGRRIKLGLTHHGRVLERRIVPAHADQPLAARLPDICQLIREMCQSANVELASCRGIGVSYPSVIDPVDGRILDEFGKYGSVAANDLRAWAAHEFNLPLAIENDARMALIGEWRYGAGQHCDNLVMITLGTGLGTAAIIEGHLLRGRHGQAGILGGHLTVKTDGRRCVCGNRGCAESEASTSVLHQMVADLPEFERSGLAHETSLSYEAVFRAAADGDVAAQQLVTASLEVWSALAVNLIHAYDPEVLILGGGVMGSGNVILPHVAAWVQRHAHTPWGQVRVMESRLRDDAALLAAEWLVDEQLRRNE